MAKASPRKVPPFQHKALDLSGLCIRLLEVLPRDGRRTIRCKIRHVHLLGRTIDPSYIALSYVWGDASERRHTIRIEDKPFAVRENLYGFLDTYGNDGLPNLWVDSICIDQRNTEERNHQVQLMQHIYSRAAKVVVWLGPSNLQIDKLFDTLNGIHILEAASSSATSTEVVQRTELGALRLSLKENLNIQAAIQDLCRRRYWARAWIVQEILLAREIELVCGAKRLPWKSWIFLIREVFIQPSRSDDSQELVQAEVPGGSFSVVKLYHEWDERQRGKGSQSLWSLVRKFAGQECLQLADKVYAFLGLAVDAHLLQVDYNMSLESLLLAVLAMAPAAITVLEIRELCELLRPCPAQVVLAMDLAISQRSLPVSSQRLRAKQQALLDGAETYPFPQIYQTPDTLDKTITALTEPKFPLKPTEDQGKNLSYRNCECFRCLHSKSSRQQIAMAYLLGDHAGKGSNLHFHWFTLQGIETAFAFLTLNDDYLMTTVPCNASGVYCHYYEPQTPCLIARRQKNEATLSILQVLNLMAHQTRHNFQDSGTNGTPRTFGNLPNVAETTSTYVSGYVPIMNCLLNTGIFQADSPDQDGRTPLSHATECTINSHKALSILLSRTDIQVDRVDNYQRSAFMHAVLNKNREAILLLAARTDVYVDRIDINGKSAFFYAASNGDRDTMAFLSSRNDVNVNRLDNEGKNALIYAILKRDHETETFLSSTTDANINSVDAEGRSPLIHATLNGDQDTVEFLSSRVDVDVNLVDRAGYSALSYAARQINPYLVEYLAPKVDAIDQADMNGDTVLHHLVAGRHGLRRYKFEEDFESCLKSLIRHGASLSTRNNQQWTPHDVLLSQRPDLTVEAPGYGYVESDRQERQSFLRVLSLMTPFNPTARTPEERPATKTYMTPTPNYELSSRSSRTVSRAVARWQLPPANAIATDAYSVGTSRHAATPRTHSILPYCSYKDCKAPAQLNRRECYSCRMRFCTNHYQSEFHECRQSM